MARHIPHPPHPFRPSDEDRNTAIAHVASARLDPRKWSAVVLFTHHEARFRPRSETHDVLVTYTPLHARNQQSSDVVQLGAPVLVSSR